MYWKALAGTAAIAYTLNVYAAGDMQIYGSLDLALAHTRKSQGHVQGTVAGMSGGMPIPDSVAAPRSSSTAMLPSLTLQNYVGLASGSDLGDGNRASITLEGGFAADDGQSLQDGRLFGRQAYVALGTRYGEWRAGRQASPMLIAYNVVTTEGIGSTDLLASGVAVNSLQSYQDNMLAYLLQQGPWIAAASYSFNAGVAGAVSAARANPTSSTPPASPYTGQILGGASAGAETSDRRGRAHGLMAAYAGNALTLVGSYHTNRFDVPVGFASDAAGFIPLFQLRDYRAAMFGAKYVIDAKTALAATYHSGTYSIDGVEDLGVRTFAAGVRHSIDAYGVGLAHVRSRLQDLTRGSNSAWMLSLDYAFSKRTVLYSRIGFVDDRRGNVVPGAIAPLPVAGGPATLLVPLGLSEIPVFSGTGAQMDGRTSLASVGIRHTF